MGKVKVGINGFGRIGRLVFKTITELYPNDLEVVAVNDLFDAKQNAHLLKYDSTYGIWGKNVEVAENDIVVDGKVVKVFAEKDPGNLKWGDLGVDIVIESTGVFTDAIGDPAKGKAGANVHIQKGGQRRSSSPLLPKTKISPLCLASMNPSTILPSTMCFPMRPAQRTAWHPQPRWFMTNSIS